MTTTTLPIAIIQEHDLGHYGEIILYAIGDGHAVALFDRPSGQLRCGRYVHAGRTEAALRYVAILTSEKKARAKFAALVESRA